MSQTQKEARSTRQKGGEGDGKPLISAAAPLSGSHPYTAHKSSGSMFLCIAKSHKRSACRHEGVRECRKEGDKSASRVQERRWLHTRDENNASRNDLPDSLAAIFPRYRTGGCPTPDTGLLICFKWCFWNTIMSSPQRVFCVCCLDRCIRRRRSRPRRTFRDN